MGLSPRDMDFTSLKHMSAKDIALVFGVPSQIIGIPDSQTYSNFSEAKLALYNETIIPLSHFKVVYDVMTDSRNTLSQREFSKRMTRLNIKTARKRISKDRSAGIPRGVVLTWKLDNCYVPR